MQGEGRVNPLSSYFAMGKLIALLATIGIICAQASMIHRWHKHYDSERAAHLADNAAHDQTVANYRAAAEQARKADAANKARVEAEADRISQEQADEYQARIAAARARAERLRSQAGAGKADPCGSGTAPVSGVSAPAEGTAEAACKDRLPAGDALTATEQAIQLDELIKWVIKVAHINVNAGDLQSDEVK